MNNTWTWIYGNECSFMWKHFGMEDRSSDDRMKVKFVAFEEGDHSIEYPSQEENNI